VNDLLNDLLNDPLDDQLRTMMRTAVGEPPAPPSIDDLAPLVSIGPEPRQPGFRPLTAIAAVIAVVAVGGLVLWPTADDAIDPADSTVPEVVAGDYLDAYYLPTELPAGWQIVEMTRQPARGEGYGGYGGNSVVFERRDGSDRAVVSLSPTESAGGEVPASTEAVAGFGDAIAEAASPDSARWDMESRFLTWRSDGQEVFVNTRSKSEVGARALATDLVPAMTSAGRSFDVAASSDWVKVREYLLNGQWIPVAGSNAITLASDQGQTLSVFVNRPFGVDARELALPVDGRPDISRFDFPAPDKTVYLARGDGDLVLETFPFSDVPVTEETQLAILGSMSQVTVDEWLAATPDISAELSTTAVVASFDLLDHVVTVHLEGALSGVCVERADGVSGCLRMDGIDAGGHLPGSSPATGFWLSDGSWVAVSSIPVGSEMCSDPQALQGATAATAPNGDEQVVLLLVPSLGFTEGFVCPLGPTKGDGSSPYDLYVANPPDQT